MSRYGDVPLFLATFFGVVPGFLGTFLGYSRIFGYHFRVLSTGGRGWKLPPKKFY